MVLMITFPQYIFQNIHRNRKNSILSKLVAALAQW